MRRKLIKQGIDGLTLYVPKKWTEKHNLKGGDEIDFSDIDGNLLISPVQRKQESRKIEINAEKGGERLIRIPVINAYRAGFDKIILNYDGNESLVKNTVNHHLIGFEVFRQEKTYSIESIAEPTYEDFDKIVQKIFLITLEIYKNISEDIEDYVNQVQKYTNFLKRCISKNIVSIKANTFIWQFIGDLNHIAREAHHLKESVKTFKPDSKEKEIIMHLIKMLEILQKGYLKKDINHLMQLHNLEEEINKKRKQAFLKSKEPLIPYYLFHIIRLIYLSSSSLVGALEVENMKNSTEEY